MKISPADIFTIGGAAIFFLFGLAYLYKSISIKNHCSTIQQNLDELNSHNRTFLFALMRSLGGGVMAFSATIIYLQVQYSKYSLSWVPLLILTSTTCFFLFSVNSMLLIKRRTTVKPPILLLTGSMLSIFLGFLLNYKIV
jgi:hypothetical protein